MTLSTLYVCVCDCVGVCMCCGLSNRHLNGNIMLVTTLFKLELNFPDILFDHVSVGI